MASSFHTSWSSILGEKEINREKKKQEKIFHDAWDSINEEKWKNNLKVAKDRKEMTKRVNEYLTQQSETALKTRNFDEINNTYSSLRQFDHNLGKTIPSVVNDSASSTTEALPPSTQKPLKHIPQPSNSKRRKYIRESENSSYTAYRAQLDNQISYKVSYSSTQESSELTEVNTILKSIERLTDHREKRDVLIKNLKLENRQKLDQLFHELLNQYDNSLLQLETDLNKRIVESCNVYERDVSRSIALTTINEVINDVVQSVDWVSNWKTFSILHNTLDSSFSHAESAVLNDSAPSVQLLQDASKLLNIRTGPIDDFLFSRTNPPLSMVTSLIKPISGESGSATTLPPVDDPDFIIESLARNESLEYFNSLASFQLLVGDEAVVASDDFATKNFIESDEKLDDSDWIMRTDLNAIIGEVLLRVDHFKNKTTPLAAVLEPASSLKTNKGLYPYPCRIVLSCLNSTLRSQCAKLLKLKMPHLVLISVDELLMCAIDHGRDLIASESVASEVIAIELSDKDDANIAARSDQSPDPAALASVQEVGTKEELSNESSISRYVRLAKEAYMLVCKGLPVTDDIYTSLILHRLQELSDTTWDEEEKAKAENKESTEDSIATPNQYAYGWLLYDYPNTRSQALSLTKALSMGIDYDDAGRLPQINDKGSKICLPKQRASVYTDLAQCGLTSYIYLDSTNQENVLYTSYVHPPSAVMKDDLHRFLKMSADDECIASDIVTASAHMNHQFHRTSNVHVSSEAELFASVPSVNQFTAAGSTDLFIRHKEMLHMEELFQRLDVLNKYAIDLASNLSDIAESVYSKHHDEIKSFIRIFNWSRNNFPDDLLDSENEHASEAAIGTHDKQQDLSSPTGASEGLLAVEAVSVAAAQAPSFISSNSKSMSKVSAPSSKAIAEVAPTKPAPPIFNLHEILADLWSFTEKRSFDQAFHIYNTFRTTRLRYMHRRHLVYHNLVAVLNQKENRTSMLGSYIQEFNSKQYDVFRFETPFKDEMMLRNYELFSNLQMVAFVRKQDSIKYISQICADNVVNLMLASIYISVVYFIQTEYTRFIANLNIFFDYVKTMADIPTALEMKTAEDVNVSSRIPSRQLLEETSADYDTGESKKVGGKAAAKPKDAKAGRDGGGAGAPRNPVPADDALPVAEDWKPLLPDVAVTTVITSCLGQMSAGTSASAAAGGDKKGKTADAKAGDKNKKGSAATTTSSATATTTTTTGRIATTYNQSALSVLLKNTTSKLEESVNAAWGATTFTVNRALYGDNQDLAERIEKTVQYEAKRFICQIGAIREQAERQAQWFVTLDEAFTLYLQESVAEMFHIQECEENIAISRSIEAAIDNNTTIKWIDIDSAAASATTDTQA